MDEFEYNLTVTVTGSAKAVKMQIPVRMEPVSAEGKGPIYVDAVNAAIHNLSRMLAKAEAEG